jgi:hypothetical protein
MPEFMGSMMGVWELAKYLGVAMITVYRLTRKGIFRLTRSAVSGGFPSMKLTSGKGIDGKLFCCKLIKPDQT